MVASDDGSFPLLPPTDQGDGGFSDGSKAWSVLFQKNVYILGLVLFVDISLTALFCMEFFSTEDSTNEMITSFGFARVAINTLVFIGSFLWSLKYRNVQEETLDELEDCQKRSASFLKLPRVDAESEFSSRHMSEVTAFRKRVRFKLWIHILLAFDLIFNSCMAFYMSTLCVSYDYEFTNAQSPIIFLLVTLTSCEFFAVKMACDAVTRSKGRAVPSLHNPKHKLYFWNKLPFHWCDICAQRIEGIAWRCKRCDFDVCCRCYDEAIDSEARRLTSRLRTTTEHSAMEFTGSSAVHSDYDTLPKIEGIHHESVSYRVFEIAWSYRFGLFVATVCLTCSTLANLLLPKLQSNIIDAVYESNVDQFFQNISTLIICSCLMIFFGVVRDGIIAAIGRMIATSLRDDIFAVIVRQKASYFDKSMTGYFTAIITNDVNAAVAPWKTVFNNLLVDCLMVIGCMIMCTLTSWRLTGIAISSSVPVIYVAALYTKWSTQVNREIWTGIADANAVATEVLGNILSVKIFDTEEQSIERFRVSTDNSLKKGIRDALGAALANAATQNFRMIGSVLIFVFGGWEAISHPERLSSTQLITFLLYWNAMSDAYQDIGNKMNEFARGNAALRRVLELILTLEENLDDAQTQRGENLLSKVVDPGENVGLSIDFENVYFSYRQSLVLNNISLSINANDLVVICGKSGSGKTTIVRLLLGLYEATSGSILFDGVLFDTLNRCEIRRMIALVSPGDMCLFSTSILDNITYGLEPNSFTVDEVVAASKAAQAHEFIMETQAGYYTHLSENGRKLSPGERVRIAIARALMRRPRLLVMDEPFSSLDAMSSRPLEEALEDSLSKSSITTLLITHTYSHFVNRANLVYVLSNGRVVEKGSYSELSKNPSSRVLKCFKH